MKTKLMILLAAVSLSGLATTANASVGVNEDTSGGSSWSCTDADAAYGKWMYGYGDEGLKWYRCVHKDWTFDSIGLLYGRSYWLHNSTWPFIHYENANGWEGQK